MLTKLAISSEELERLNYERYHYPCPLVQKRLHAIYTKAVTNFSDADVGTIVSAHHNSIRKWINDYSAYGLDSLLQVNYGTNTSILEPQAVSIIESFTTQPPRSISEAALRVKEYPSYR